MTLFTIRASARKTLIAACGLVVATGVAACSSGQQAQTAVQEPAVNGTRGTVQNIDVLDVRIEAEQTGDSVPSGQTVDLAFVATNQSPDQNDKLVRITSDVGRVEVKGDTDLKALNSLIAGGPEGPEAAAMQAASTASQAQARVKLDKPISSGLSYSFTFTFERAGDLTVSVPVSADMDAPRQDAGAAHGEGQGEGH